MSYEHSEASAQHSLSLEGRNKMSITGVLDVNGFDDSTVILTTSQGELHIRGESLRVDRIDPDMGQVLINGLVQELRYDEAAPARSLWSRLFG
ncbi:MAG: sporulation protein [Oscillospiraceae bacterium]|nr:sporulation protein [Oscillospiraceae bacterium]